MHIISSAKTHVPAGYKARRQDARAYLCFTEVSLLAILDVSSVPVSKLFLHGRKENEDKALSGHAKGPAPFRVPNADDDFGI